MARDGKTVTLDGNILSILGGWPGPHCLDLENAMPFDQAMLLL